MITRVTCCFSISKISFYQSSVSKISFVRFSLATASATFGCPRMLWLGLYNGLFSPSDSTPSRMPSTTVKCPMILAMFLIGVSASSIPSCALSVIVSCPLPVPASSANAFKVASRLALSISPSVSTFKRGISAPLLALLYSYNSELNRSTNGLVLSPKFCTTACAASLEPIDGISLLTAMPSSMREYYAINDMFNYIEIFV